jgi:formylglycine-generating enzyme required for sulfatase activity
MDRSGEVMPRAPWGLACGLVCAVSASCREAPPPLGEAVVVVDTDAPVPALIGRLRVDFYTAAGEWFESRDVAAPEPSAWPVSFSVFTPDEASAHTVLVRLRAYGEGKTRDYRGERFTPRGEVEPEPVETRLVVSGADVTPRAEPQPLLTIDRILRIVLEPGHVGSARAVLRGACFGTMANLGTGESCIDTEDARAPLATTLLDADLSLPRTTLAGTFGAAEPCAGAPGDDEVCVPGGVFVFGNAARYGVGDLSGVPERVANVGAFYMDRHEYTVARWRAVFAADPGAFGAGHVILNDEPIANGATSELDEQLCTASHADLGRERFALSCVTWDSARELCRRAGGDLPTEAQWEYAAQRAGRPGKTQFPWGSEGVTCDRAVYGRFAGGSAGRKGCAPQGTGPLPVDAREKEPGDVSALGIVGLGGGVAELLRDAFFGLEAPCWRSAGLREPGCAPDAGPRRSIRGGDWTINAIGVGSEARRLAETPSSYAPSIGFRCVRPAGVR